jgi:hypothetical protein
MQPVQKSKKHRNNLRKQNFSFRALALLFASICLGLLPFAFVCFCLLNLQMI